MEWIKSSRWRDLKINGNLTKEEKLQSALNLLVDREDDDEVIKITKVFPENQYIELDNGKIQYNVVNFSISPKDETNENEFLAIETGWVVVYIHKNEVNYIINKNSGAMTQLRKLLNYTGRSEIKDVQIPFENDLMIWLIKHVFNQDNDFSFTDCEGKEKQLAINSIIGMRGETPDANKLSAHGNTVLNLISTLSFILESDKLQHMLLRLEYTNHENIEVKIQAKGQVSIEVSSYSGKYENEEDKKAKVLLLVYVDLLPIIIQAYRNERSDDNWNLDEKTKFYTQIKDEVVQKLENSQQFKLN